MLLALLTIAAGLSAQSRIPGDPANYLYAVGNITSGDRDTIVVVFFEVPDTITQTLYVAINSPGEEVPLTTGAPDVPGPGTTVYTLIGGAGALSDPRSRQQYYSPADIAAGNHKIGTKLAQNTYTTQTTLWGYFSGVSPSQGEHIGNKYYFKVVVEPDASVYKNAFQLDVSYANSGIPTGISGVRAFAYCWTLGLQNRVGWIWNIYPFVPSGATGNINYYNFDADDGAVWEAFDKSGAGPFAVTASSPGNVYPGDEVFTAFAIGAQTNGTWRLRITENTLPGFENPTEVWFTNSATGEVYRAYAAAYTPPAADHIAVAATDGVAVAGGTDFETVTLQAVDSTGTPTANYYHMYVQASGSAKIKYINNVDQGATPPAAAYVDTDSNGLATVGITDTAVEAITVSVTTNGSTAPGTDATEANLPGTNQSAGINFQANPPPAVSSASNLTFTAGSAATLATITITDSGTADINAAGDVRIRIPSGLDAVFNTGAVVTPTVSGAGGGTVGAVSYESGNKVARIDVTTNFAVTNILTVSGLAFTAVNTASSGRLELSVDGGTTYVSVDDKLITITNASGTYTWNGTSSVAWNTPANWTPAGPPAAGADVVIPGTGVTFMPTLDTSPTVGSLSVQTGATLTTSTFSLTINRDLTLGGTLNASAQTGAQSITIGRDLSGTGTFTGGAGAVSFTGTGPRIGTSVTTATGAISVTNAATLTGSVTLNTGAGAGNISFGSTVNGPYALTLSAGTGSVALGGAIGGTTALSSLMVSGTGALALPATTVTGNVTATMAGALTQTGALIVPGNSSFSAGANPITLNNAANNFTGTVALSNSGANNVALTDVNALALAASSVGSGTLSVTASGAITQTGAVVQAAGAGTASFSAGAGPITLNNAANNFTGAVGLSNSGANNVALTDVNALALAASSVGSGTLTVIANGAITQTGAVVQAAAAGVASFSAGANPITLNNAANDFTGAVNLSNSGANLVQVSDTNSIQLGTLAIGGGLTVSAGSGITQTAVAITVPGAAVLTAGAGPITLTTAGNDFQSTVALSNSGANNVAVTDVNALALAASSVGSGTLTVIANGAITQTGAVVQAAGAGIASFSAGANPITLNNAANDFTGAVNLSNSGANLVQVSDTNSIQLGTLAIGAGLTVSAGSGITQTAVAITVPGAAILSAGAGPITLTTAGNDFQSTVALTNSGANNVALTDVNALALAASSVGSGTLTVTAGGAITQTGAVVQAAGAGHRQLLRRRQPHHAEQRSQRLYRRGQPLQLRGEPGAGQRHQLHSARHPRHRGGADGERGLRHHADCGGDHRAGGRYPDRRCRGDHADDGGQRLPEHSGAVELRGQQRRCHRRQRAGAGSFQCRQRHSHRDRKRHHHTDGSGGAGSGSRGRQLLRGRQPHHAEQRGQQLHRRRGAVELRGQQRRPH